ncbi:MAG: hypothetical protein SOZ58_06170 [Prevotella sp.]|nr:hypothetical protein [Prevotella sp.]
MKNITNKFHKGIFSRLSATVIMLAMGCLASFADNRLYIEPFEIAPGETQQVKIILDNDDPINSLQFDLYFNDGISFVDGSYAFDAETKRVTKSSHKPKCSKFNAGFYRCGLLSNGATMEASVISGNRGSILTIEVKADESFTGTKEAIEIKNVRGSNATVEPAVSIKMEDVTVSVSALIGKATALTDEIATRPGTPVQLGVAVTNNIEIANFQALVTLPEGVSPIEDENGEKVVFSSRVSDNFSYTLRQMAEPNTYLLVVECVMGDVIEGNEGPLFYLNLAANKALEGNITISDFEVSSTAGMAYNIKSDISVKIKSFDDPSGDGVWDIDDINSVISAYNGVSEAENNDVNGDGVIDIDDINAIIAKYNETK